MRLIEKFLSREPTEGDRLEILLAHVATTFLNFQSAQGSPQATIDQFLLFRDPWAKTIDELLADERYSDLDREIFRKLR